MPKLFLLGDSTCAEKLPGARPETGWGEKFQQYLKDGWTIRNYAKNGRSTKSCLLEGIYYDCFFEAEEGDWAIIQFGHNENKPEEFRRTDPDTSFTANLRFMATNFLRKGVKVIFASPISRRRFEKGIAQNTHFGYPQAMERTAGELGIPFLEMTQRTLDHLNEAGEEASEAYFMNFGPGQYPNYPEGREDNTHLRPEGAEWIAGSVREAMDGLDLPFLK